MASLSQDVLKDRFGNISNIFLVLNGNCMGCCVCIYPPLWDVSVHGLFFQKWIGPVTMVFFYIIFIYETKDNQQECSRLSNWFSLRCLGRRGWTTWFLFLYGGLPLVFALATARAIWNDKISPVLRSFVVGTAKRVLKSTWIFQNDFSPLCDEI